MKRDHLLQTLEKVQTKQRADILERQEQERKTATQKMSNARDGDERPLNEYIEKEQGYRGERKQFDQQADKVREAWQTDPKNSFNNVSERELEKEKRHTESWKVAEEQQKADRKAKIDARLAQYEAEKAERELHRGKGRSRSRT